MDSIHIYWGPDSILEDAINNGIPEASNFMFLSDIMPIIDHTEISIKGYKGEETPPMEVPNLVIHTDDYGGVKEWAISGFSNNILNNLKLKIASVWMINPPQKIYDDIRKNYESSIIDEHPMRYPPVTEETLKKIADGFDKVVMGQPNIVRKILPSICSLSSKKRKRPVTLLFLGNSGVGKTETAKYISNCIGGEMVRIQFSMQQTMDAAQFIFGANHSENSLSRELIRRRSNVILLDEFDKVPPAFYNAFYQMFDEGIFVDKNYTVDVSECIVICTSNYHSEEEAEKYLGTPIFSRFSKVIQFKDIDIDVRIKIAEKTFNQILDDIEVEEQEYVRTSDVLQTFINAIKSGKYVNIRMLKNDIEDAIYFELLRQRNIL